MDKKKNSSLQKCLSPRPKNSKFAWIMQYYNTPDGQISYFKIEIEEGGGRTKQTKHRLIFAVLDGN